MLRSRVRSSVAAFAAHSSVPSTQLSSSYSHQRRSSVLADNFLSVHSAKRRVHSVARPTLKSPRSSGTSASSRIGASRRVEG
eukprot:6193560-Pleurochrysis_carterae.AAC.4